VLATQTKLTTLLGLVPQAGQSAALTSLLGDQGVQDALRSIKAPAVAVPLTTALDSLSDYDVRTVKQEALTNADLFGNVFTSVFLVYGLFSIAAGIMLIFLIFVMLAAERRAEMGMARAIGTKRHHLIQQFLFEGYVYDLGAALVGVALGIVVSLSMVAALTALLGSVDFTLTRHIEPRSVVVAFCLGALVTFGTVVVSSWRVSRLNIVAAIRDLPDDLHITGAIGEAFSRPLTDLATAARRLRRGQPIGALTALLAALWRLLTAFRVFISRGPLLVLGGYLLLQWGVSIRQLFPFDMGLALAAIGAAMLLRWALGGLGVPDRVRNRLGYSLAGISLIVLFLLPFDAFRSDWQFDIEMFFLAGMMLMLGGIWTVMYNIDLLLGGLLLALGGAGRLAPILKTAVTYPMQHRFRTGMTLFMFSLVIFALVVQAVFVGSYGGQHLDLNRSYGGYEVFGAISPLTPIANVGAQVAADPTLRGRIAAGSMGRLGVGLRQPGQRVQTWQGALLYVAGDDYLASTRFTLQSRATGYHTDGQVWQTLRAHPGYAVVNGNMVHSKNGGGGGFQINTFSYEDTSFRPTRIEARDGRTNRVIPLTVIGALHSNARANGLYTSVSTLAAAGLPPVTPDIYYFRVAAGQNVHATALALGAAFLPHGLDVTEARVEYNQSQAIGIGLYNLIEGFMALGLVVGVAALGVIATRSVVERRQHIGVLRATFLVESSVVALLGTVIGTVLGLLLARELVLYFAKTQVGLQVVVPWAEIGLIVVITYAASLLTTYLPAWQASRVYPAEALRYE